MPKLIKLSSLSLLAALVTVALYIGMLNLLKNKSEVPKNDLLDFSISFIKPEDDLKLKKRLIKKIPKKPKSSKPPAIPRMKIAEHNNHISSPDASHYGYNIKAFEHNTLKGPGFNFGKLNSDTMGGLKAGIPPIYPPAALFRDKEGWVEVLVDINQLGIVDKVTVLDASPADIFNDAAINAVRKWAFYPKTVNGIPLPYQLTQTIEFKIDRPVE